MKLQNFIPPAGVVLFGVPMCFVLFAWDLLHILPGGSGTMGLVMGACGFILGAFIEERLL